jgi:hypothetical protein
MAYLDRPKITVERIETNPTIPPATQQVNAALIGEANEVASVANGTQTPVIVPARLELYRNELTSGETVLITVVYLSGNVTQVQVPFTSTLSNLGNAIMIANSDLLCMVDGADASERMVIYGAPSIHQLSIPAIAGKTSTAQNKYGYFDEELPLSFIETPHKVSSDKLFWDEAEFDLSFKLNGVDQEASSFALKGSKVVKGSLNAFDNGSGSPNTLIVPSNSLLDKQIKYLPSTIERISNEYFESKKVDATADFDVAKPAPFVVYDSNPAKPTAGRNFWYGMPSIEALKLYKTIKLSLSNVTSPAQDAELIVSGSLLTVSVQYATGDAATTVFNKIANAVLPDGSGNHVFTGVVEHKDDGYAVNTLYIATSSVHDKTAAAVGGSVVTITATPHYYQAASGNGKTVVVSGVVGDPVIDRSGDAYTVKPGFINATASNSHIAFDFVKDANGEATLRGSFGNGHSIEIEKVNDGNPLTETAFTWQVGPVFTTHVTCDLDSNSNAYTFQQIASDWKTANVPGGATLLTANSDDSTAVSGTSTLTTTGGVRSSLNAIEALAGTSDTKLYLSVPAGADGDMEIITGTSTSVSFTGGRDAIGFYDTATGTANAIKSADLSDEANQVSGMCIFRIRIGDDQATVQLPTGYDSASVLQQAIESVLPGVAAVDGNYVIISTDKRGMDGFIALGDVEGNAVETAFGKSTVTSRIVWDNVQVGDFIEIKQSDGIHTGVITKVDSSYFYKEGAGVSPTAVYNKIKVAGIEATVLTADTWRILRKGTNGAWSVDSSNVLSIPGLFAYRTDGEPIQTTGYLGYIVKRLDLSGYTVNTSDDLNEVTPFTPDNPLGLAASLYFGTNKAQGLLYSVSGTKESHMDALEKAFTRETMVIVPLTSDPEILVSYKSAVDVQNDPNSGGKEALLLMAPRDPKYKVPTVFESNVPVSSNDSNTIFFDPGVLDVSIVAAQLSGKVAFITIPGYYSMWEVKSWNTSANSLDVKQSGVTDPDIFTMEDLPAGLSTINIEVLGDALASATDWIEAIAAEVSKFKSMYVRYIAPGTVQITVNGLVFNLPAYYAAALTAGIMAMRNPALPLNGANIDGLSGVMYPYSNFTDRLLGTAAAAGVSFMVQDAPGGPVIYRNFISTDTATVQTREHSLVFSDMVGARRFRRSLSKWVGPFAMDKKYDAALAAVVKGVINSLTADGIWKSAALKSVAQSPVEPTKIVLTIDRTAFMPVLSGLVRIMI